MGKVPGKTPADIYPPILLLLFSFFMEREVPHLYKSSTKYHLVLETHHLHLLSTDALICICDYEDNFIRDIVSCLNEPLFNASMQGELRV